MACVLLGSTAVNVIHLNKEGKTDRHVQAMYSKLYNLLINLWHNITVWLF